MKTNTTQVTKSQLLDYVTKLEFSEFRNEVLDRFDSTDNRFDSIDTRFAAIDTRFTAIDNRFDSVDKRFSSMDKRLNSIDKKIDQIREDFRVHTGVLSEQFSEQFKVAMEYMQHVEAKKLDKEEFEALEIRINNLLNPA